MLPSRSVYYVHVCYHRETIIEDFTNIKQVWPKFKQGNFNI